MQMKYMLGLNTHKTKQKNGDILRNNFVVNDVPVVEEDEQHHLPDS